MSFCIWQDPRLTALLRSVIEAVLSAVSTNLCWMKARSTSTASQATGFQRSTRTEISMYCLFVLYGKLFI